MTEREIDVAAAYLSRVAEPAALSLWALIEDRGYVEAAAAVRYGDVPGAVAGCTQARRASIDAEADLDAASRCGMRLLTPQDPQWPHFAFAGLTASARRARQAVRRELIDPRTAALVPPVALWVKGPRDPATLGLRSLSIVGSRAASAYGEQVASEWAYSIAARQVDIVSGGAYGIDAAAHRGALAAGGNTVLVSAGGLDRPYPSGNSRLYEQIAERGLLVSERPPGSAPYRQRFLSRNRIIAAFGAALLVVEAARRSGALNSARLARQLGRPVLAVPGPVTSAMSVGCHELLARDDAPALVAASAADVLRCCAWDDQPLLAGPGAGQSPGIDTPVGDACAAGGDGLDVGAKAVLDGFPGRRTVTEEEVSRLSGQPISAVMSALPLLTELGLITSAREGYRLVRRAPR